MSRTISWEDFLHEVAACADILRLATVLLRFCRLRAAELRAYPDARAKEQVLALKALRAWFGTIGASALVPDDGRQLAEQLRQHADTLGSEVVAAWAAAQALDEALGERFLGFFQSRGMVRVCSAESFPLLRPRWSKILGHLTTLPKHFGLDPDHLERLGLAPDDLGGITLQFEPVAPRLLDPDKLKVGFGVPNTDYWADFTHEVSNAGGRPEFFWVRAKDPRQQLDVVRSLLERARGAAPDFLVLPELSVSEGPVPACAADARMLDAVRTWFFSQPDDRKIRVLVAGSRHVELGGVRRNEAVVLLGDGTERQHLKFNPMEVRIGANDSSDVTLTEGISAAPATVVVYFTDHWSFTVLICKDFLLPAVQNLLPSLRCNLVLLPAMSPRSRDFEAQAGGLCSRAQTIIVFANIPFGLADGDAGRTAVGFVARPLAPPKPDRAGGHAPEILEARRLADVRGPFVGGCQGADEFVVW